MPTAGPAPSPPVIIPPVRQIIKHRIPPVPQHPPIPLTVPTSQERITPHHIPPVPQDPPIPLTVPTSQKRMTPVLSFPPATTSCSTDMSALYLRTRSTQYSGPQRKTKQTQTNSFKDLNSFRSFVERNYPDAHILRYHDDQLSQLLSLRKRPTWTFDTICEAQIHVTSMGSEAYDRLIHSTPIPWPTSRTIRARIRDYQVNPGVLQSSIEMLADRLKDCSEGQRDVHLLMDEMSIRSEIRNSRQFHRIVGIPSLSCRSQQQGIIPATNALCIMAKGVQHPFKLVISVDFTTNSTSTTALRQRLEQCIKELERRGIHVRACISDQGALFKSLWKELGIKSRRLKGGKNNLNIPDFSITNHFPNPARPSEKIYLIYDPTHLFKLGRNQLINHDFIYSAQTIEHCVSDLNMDPAPQSASFHYFRRVYDIQSKEQADQFFSLRPRLTERDINPQGFDKMRVKPALRLLSQSMKSLMTVYRSLNLLPDESEGTELYSLSWARFFEVANNCNPKKALCARSPVTKDHIGYLKHFAHMMVTGDFVPSHYPNPFSRQFQGRRGFKPVQSGLALTISSMCALITQYFARGTKRIFTSVFTQDSLEAFHGLLRRRGGGNPTSERVLQMLRSLSASNLYTVHKKFIFFRSTDTPLRFLSHDNKDSEPASQRVRAQLPCPDLQLEEVELQALYYVTSSAVFKVRQRLGRNWPDCVVCSPLTALERYPTDSSTIRLYGGSEDPRLYTMSRDFGGLLYCSQAIFDFAIYAYQRFKVWFPLLASESDPQRKLSVAILSANMTDSEIPPLPTCHNIGEEIVNTLIPIFIGETLTKIVEKFKGRNNKIIIQLSSSLQPIPNLLGGAPQASLFVHH
jgi:hypothetical protein